MSGWVLYNLDIQAIYIESKMHICQMPGWDPALSCVVYKTML